MKVGDFFKINVKRDKNSQVVYKAEVISNDCEWVSATIVHPPYLAEKLKNEGFFKIHAKTLDLEVLNSDENLTRAIYG